MSNDIRKTYIISIILVVIVATCTLFSFTINKWFSAGLLTISAIAVSLLIKKNRLLKTNKKKILKIMVVFGILYIALFYTLGLYTSFYKQTNILSLKTLFNYIIPITMIIISTEIIRNKLLINDKPKSLIMVTILGVLVDITIYLDMYGFRNLESFLGLLGFVTFSAIANNILYTYISRKYGKDPIIAYKLITILYMYIIPIMPDVYIYFRTFVRLLYPLLIYGYIERYYNDEKTKKRPKELKQQTISIVVGSVLTVIIIALVSCKFLYGVLVIGSESMSGNIEKGDVIVFKNKKNKVEVGDVIVFNRDKIKVVHRVIKIRNVNDEFRYYTKGDANIMADDGYITKKDLMGKVLIRIRYIGKPTLWLRQVFDKEG